MQYPPSAIQLLRAVADLLDDEVMPIVRADIQHKVRVAAHLIRVVEREIELSGAGGEEHALVAGLVGHDGPLLELNDTLADLLRAGTVDAAPEEIWDALVAITRHDLAIAKPGHDGWERG